MTSDDKFFVARAKLEKLELAAAEDDDMRDPRVRARLRVAGYVPLYEGKSFWLHNPYFTGRGSRDSVSKFVAIADVESEFGDDAWKTPRLVLAKHRELDRSAHSHRRTHAAAVHGNSAPDIERHLGRAAAMAKAAGSLVARLHRSDEGLREPQLVLS